MFQPELGRQLTALRKLKNLTQEDLTAKSNVSVRTIQRIEAGEVMPRMSTVKLLLASLGESIDYLSTKSNTTMETGTDLTPVKQSNVLITAVVAGAIYLALEIIIACLDLVWLYKEEPWSTWLNMLYIGLSTLLVAAYIFFIRGFLILSQLFENKLLTIGGYLMITAVAAISILDVSALGVEDLELLALPYAAGAVFMGALSLVFGIALWRLQDGMGQLSRVAGILEIIMGCSLITVVFFFVSYVILVPAIVVEILVLYRGYEYLSTPRQRENAAV